MLSHTCLSRLAAHCPPHRERRVLWFSGGAHPPAAGSADEHGKAPAEDAAHSEGHDKHQAVDSAAAETHGKVEGVLSAEKKLTLHGTIERIRKSQEKIASSREKLSKLKTIIETKMKPEDKEEHLHTLKSNLEFLDNGVGTMDSWCKLLDHFSNWKGGKMHPVEFITKMQQYSYPDDPSFVGTALKNLYESHPEIGSEPLTSIKTVDEKTGEQVGTLQMAYGTQWETLNISQRIEIAASSSAGVLEFMNGYLDKLDPALKENTKYAESVEKLSKATDDDGTFDLKIKFLSINNVIEGVKNVVDAFKQAGKEWSQLRVAGFSAQLGNIAAHLPFGDSAQQTLSAALNHKDDEVKDNYAKHLESDIVPFYEMIPSHHGVGFLERNKNDGNRFRGSLEYMAKKAWLYDIDIENNTVMGHKLIPGKTVPATWTDVNVKEYMVDLDGKNKSGQTAEKERGYKRVDRIASIAPGIDILRREIEDGNYWAVLGIMNRLLEKAKDGETACWIATSIMGMLRKNHTARRYFPIELLDRLGNEGLVHLANTNIHFVLDRWKIREWADETGADNTAADSRLEETGTLGDIIKRIESDIRHMEEISPVPHMSQDKLERTVAKVMASQVVTGPNWKSAISIFNSKYDDYRKQLREGGEGKAIDPSKTDDDFFNADSEMVMHGRDIVARILDVASPNKLQYEEKGKAFLGQLIRRCTQLKKAGLTEELNTFKDETRETMKYVFDGKWSGSAYYSLASLKHSEIDGTTEGKGKYLLHGMMDLGLIDRNHIATLETALGKAIRKQAGIPDPPDSGKTKASSGGE